ncbi:MAG: HdeD family acid-resistance protein [Verrucomicrobiales bacterium]
MLAIVFGVLAFLFPLAAGLTLTLLWGAYAFTEGVVALVTAFQVRQSGRPIWPMVMMGVLGILAGVMTFLAPRMTMLALLLLVAAWAVAVGGLMIVTAIRLRDEIEGEWFLGLAGLISVLFGIAMCAFPVSGAVTVAWVVAGHAVVLGLLLVLFAFKVRGMGRDFRAAASAAA